MMKKYKKILVFIVVMGLFFPLLPSVEASGKRMSVKISKKKITITVGKKKRLKGKIYHKKGKVKLYWKSTNKRIVTVNSKGILRGIKKGTAKVYVGIRGKKKRAVCKVTVRAAGKDNEVKSTVAPTDKPKEAAETKKPVKTEDPIETEKPTNTITPVVTVTPSHGSPLVKVAVDNIDGMETSVFIVDKSYEGILHISFCGHETTQAGSVKDALVLLKSSYMTDNVAKMNKDKTISIYRGSKEENWKITDLLTGEEYELWVETQNSYDTFYSNCGAIYFKGNVVDKVTVY